MYMAHTHTHTRTHTQLCRKDTHLTNEHKAFGRWMLDGNTEKGGGARTLTEGRGLIRLGGGEGGRSEVEVNGGRTTCKSKSEVQPPLQKHDSLYLSKTNET